MRQVMAQVDQGGHQTVHEDQPVPGAGPGGPFPRPASDLGPVVFNRYFPGVWQDRAVDLDRHSQSMPRPSSKASPAITHQLVRTSMNMITKIHRRAR